MNKDIRLCKGLIERRTVQIGARPGGRVGRLRMADAGAAVLLIALILAGCGRTQVLGDAQTPVSAAQGASATQVAPVSTPASTDSPMPPATSSPMPAATEAPSPTPQPVEPATVALITPAVPTPEPATATHTPSPPPLAAAPSAGPELVIDHTSIADFARIPDEYLARAAQLSFLFRGASVGYNISDGLDCLMNNFESRRPNFCDRGLAPDQVLFDPKYDRSRWQFEPHSPPPNPNPGWWDKVTFFVDRVNSMGPGERYDVVTFTFDYVDVLEGGNMDDLFFQAERSGDLPIVQDLAALEAAHPDKQFVWWTSNLARAIGTPDSESFNQQMREYAAANGKVLFDMADIESHAPDGAPCFDNKGGGIPAICPDYTEEREAGHLNALGQQRVAKALWVLMARLASWDQ